MKTTLKSLKIFSNGMLLIVACAAAPAETRPSKESPQWVTPDVFVPRLQQRLFDSAAAKTKVSYFIYTPEVYDTDKELRLPVLYWLHGSGGGERGLRPLVKHFDTAIRAGKIPPMLIVFPNGMASSMWCDAKDGSVPMETVVIQEILPDVDAHFRTLASRESRILEGFSMGGYGAARLGFKYPELFATVSILGGGPLQEEFDPDTAPRSHPREARELMQSVYGDDQNYFKACSPWVIAEKNAAVITAKTRVRQVIGDRDNTLANNRVFHDHLAQLKIPHTFTVLPNVKHDPQEVFAALGETNWEFYRTALGEKRKPD